MKTELKNPELIKLDEEIFNANKFYSLAGRSLGNFPNFYAVEEFLKIANDLLGKLEKIETDDEFEAIFIENSTYNLKSQKIFLEYFSKGGINAEELFKEILGEESLDILRENIKNFDYKKLWDYYLSYQEYAHKSIPVDDENIREKMRETLNELKKDILEYATKYYGFPEDYDFDLVLGQPYSQRTFFHPTNRRMEISPGAFFIYKEDNELKMNVTAVIQVMFHELIGHGRHEIYSKDFPLAMQDNSINTSIEPLHVHFEGVSQLSEKESIDFMKKFKEKYNIIDDYITQRIFSETENEIANFSSYYKYLGLKKIEQNDFNQNEEFKKITNNHGLAILYSQSNLTPFSALRDATYPLGLKILKKILNEIKEEIGEENYNKNIVEINKVISSGVFNFRVLPKFIRYYLKGKGIISK